ncbi:MAG: HdeD family acid-resistance protein [Gammaproteobacteria bacterium]
MVDNRNSQPGIIPGTVFGNIGKHWGWLLALGILFILLGTIGLGLSFVLTLTTVLLFGVLIAIGGVVQLVQAFRFKGWGSIFWHVLIGLLYLIAGVLIITDPVLASTVFTAMIAWILVAVGVLRLFMAVQMRGTNGWGWTLLGGLVSIALGVMILAQWPASGLWVIGLFVAIEMIVNGWSCVLIALAARRAGEQIPPAA